MVGPTRPAELAKKAAPLSAPKYSKPGGYGKPTVTKLPSLDPERTAKILKDPIRMRRLEDERKRSNDENLGGQRRRRNHLLRGL